jgi:uncharacterized DUF497 family protein
MELGWHPAKREKTVADREIDFAGLLAAFSDPKRLVAQDTRKDYGETRFNMIAMCRGELLHITYTPRGELTWIISARKANRREQRRYAQG